MREATAGNERLTALAGAVLLVLIVVEVLTLPNLRALLSVHVVVGVVLAGPLAVKIGSTGYRFVRYYTRSPAYVRRGPPHLALRLLAPVLVATTIVAVGSGILLVVTGPAQASGLRTVHVISSIAWLPVLSVHTLAHAPRLPRVIADDWPGVRRGGGPEAGAPVRRERRCAAGRRDRGRPPQPAHRALDRLGRRAGQRPRAGLRHRRPGPRRAGSARDQTCRVAIAPAALSRPPTPPPGGAGRGRLPGRGSAGAASTSSTRCDSAGGCARRMKLSSPW